MEPNRLAPLHKSHGEGKKREGESNMHPNLQMLLYGTVLSPCSEGIQSFELMLDVIPNIIAGLADGLAVNSMENFPQVG